MDAVDSPEYTTIKNSPKIQCEILEKLQFLIGVAVEANADIPLSLTQVTITTSQLLVQISQFETCPQLIDASLLQYVSLIAADYIQLKAAQRRCAPTDLHAPLITARIQSLCDLVYCLVKVRGLKAVTSCLESDLYMVEELISYLGPNQTGEWKENYFVLLWLSIMVLMPFPLSLINSALPEKLFGLLNGMLGNASNKYGKENEVASYCLAKLLTRSDMIELGFLKRFYDGFAKITCKLGLSVIVNPTLNPLSVNDSLRCMNYILKFIRFHDIEPHIYVHLGIVKAILAHASEPHARVDMIRVIKNLKNLACNYIFLQNQYLLDPDHTDYDAQLEEILTMLTNMVDSADYVMNTDARYCLGKDIAKVIRLLPLDYQVDIINFVLQKLDVKEVHREFLRDITLGVTQANRDVYICPQESSYLSVDTELVNIESYHTVFLVMAELLRTSVLPVTYFPLLERLLRVFCFFKQLRITFTIGSQLRDACCFIAWAMFRNYSALRRKNPMGLICVSSIGCQLMLMTCFDSDLMIRRAGAAGIQELIGRFGGSVFEHQGKASAKALTEIGAADAALAVRLIEELDYIKLGNLSRSFDTAISFVEKLPYLKNSLFLDFLLTRGITSFEYELRYHSAQLLARFLETENEQRVTAVFLQVYGSWVTETQAGRPADGLLGAIACILLVTSSSFDSFHRSITATIEEYVTYDFHRDPFYKGEELLQLLTAVMKQNPAFTILEKLWDAVFQVIRIDHVKIVLAFQEFCRHISLTEQDWERFMKYMRNGNLATVKAVGYLLLVMSSHERIAQLVVLLKDPSIQAESRAALMHSFSIIVQRAPAEFLTYDLLFELVQQLDDYTITQQGDVGNKIRLATITMLNSNWRTFFVGNLEFEIEKRLLRLSCEIIDKIKYKALGLIIRINGMDLTSVFGSDMSVAGASDNYYDVILDVYRKFYLDKSYPDTETLQWLDELSHNFWRGYVFSAGALSASNYTISKSFVAFLKFFTALGDDAKVHVLTVLLSLLKPAPAKPSKGKVGMTTDRNLKCQLCTLNLFVHLLDSFTPLPDGFNTKALYIRAYNLHLNTTNVERIQRVIGIFNHILLRQVRSQETLAFADPLKRILWLISNHPVLRVRQLAAEALFEVYDEMLNKEFGKEAGLSDSLSAAMDILQRVDWTQDVKKIKIEAEGVTIKGLN
ncbi:hypothetical protein BABINDRAFT_163116 [Babjeviella inositovora NRRL Y-12698]|uniref:Tubulin-folding cofactor D ARM repeats domain-containing protein n=1 Tax=Babjeviella inositovora NRRL Y-12698 TaxID=984486 RepID=A0A1E3QLY6_9ASCO|nr:uncharacterized protein BABINDRAFT_163116 [Babjeviella inositovora NRRL Y-12698]ODQ78092.1 hypothetical protein BABINDRAFT_163116 [Babjeviella inositovora NRRL Y-12698]